VVLFALLATGAYLAFDVLDLDGSDLTPRPVTAAVTGETMQAEPEGWHRPPPLPGTVGAASQEPATGAVAFLPPAVPSVAAATRGTRWGRGLPRGRVGGEAAASTSAPDDPA
jgi:hypothetical protein